jgi:hypothetical protein
MNHLAVGAAAAGALVGAVATRFQLLPDVVDLSFVLTASGLGGLLCTLGGVAAGLPYDRLVRVIILGQVLGGLAGAAVVVIGAAAD